MKILVTGSEGYIGKHLIKKLRIVDTLDNRGSPTYKLDIRDKIAIDEEYDVVIHLAALVQVGESVKDPYSYYDTNMNGTINVLNGIKTKNFILASTGAVESLNSPYAISKKACEDIVQQFAESNNINYTIFRFYNVIGSDGFKPTNPDGLFYALIRATETGEFDIYGSDYNTKDGTAIRDYVHVNQICDAIITAISKPANSIECLGTGLGHTVLEITDAFKEANYINFNVNMKERRDGDVENAVLSNPSTYLTNSYTLIDLLALKNYK